MKNLKLFEDFFKFYTYSTVTETKLLWGFNNSSVELKQNHTKIKKLMASFSGKVYGKRSAERRRKSDNA